MLKKTEKSKFVSSNDATCGFICFQNLFFCRIYFAHGILLSCDWLYFGKFVFFFGVRLTLTISKTLETQSQFGNILHTNRKLWIGNDLNIKFLPAKIVVWWCADWFKVFANVRFTPRMGGNTGLLVCMMCILFVDFSKYFCTERRVDFDGVTM